MADAIVTAAETLAELRRHHCKVVIGRDGPEIVSSNGAPPATLITEVRQNRTEIAALVERERIQVRLAAGTNLRVLMQQHFTPRREFVYGIFVEGVTVFGGRAKIGKSWMIYGTSLALATGGVALGKVEVDQTGVLLLALEDGEQRLQDRFDRLLRGSEPPENLHIFTRWPRLDDGGKEQLREFLSVHSDVRAVFIDTLARIRPRRKSRGDLYMEDYAVGEALKEIAEEFHALICIVTHTRKAPAEDPLEEITGTMGLTGGVDNCIVLKRTRGQADGELAVMGRDIREEKEYALSFNPALTQWTIAGDANEFRMSKQRLDIINVLRVERRRISPAQVAGALNRDANAVKQLMWKMGNEGTLRSEGGEYWYPHTSSNRGNRGDSDDTDNVVGR